MRFLGQDDSAGRVFSWIEQRDKNGDEKVSFEEFVLAYTAIFSNDDDDLVNNRHNVREKRKTLQQKSKKKNKDDENDKYKQRKKKESTTQHTPHTNK